MAKPFYFPRSVIRRTKVVLARAAVALWSAAAALSVQADVGDSGVPLLGCDGSDGRLFDSGFEAGLSIIGRTTLPVILDGSTVTAAFGDRCVQGVTDAEGRYAFLFEYRSYEPEDMVRLHVRGVGDRSHVEWLAYLGEADELRQRAGAAGIVDQDIEAFANLGPRSTAVAAAMWAENGSTEIHDAVTFHGAARSLQAPLSELTEALALQAVDELQMVEDTTWAEITAPRGYFSLFYRLEQMSNVCGGAGGTTVYCEMRRTLADSEAVYPPVLDPIGVHAKTYGHDFSGVHDHAAHRVTAVSVSDSAAVYQSSRGGAPVEVQVADEGDGTWLLTRLGGEPLETYSETGTDQVDVVEVRLQLNRGVAGLTEMRLTAEERVSSLQNPNLPPVHRQRRDYQPALSAANPLPPTHAIVPEALEQSRWVLAMPLSNVSAPGAMLDVHDIGLGGGSTERLGWAFSIEYSAGDRFHLTYPDATVQVRLINQDHPDFWRAEYLVDRPGAEMETVIHGVAIRVRPENATWSLPEVPGSYVSWSGCDGPWGEAHAYASKTCINQRGSPYRFRANGTGDLYEGDLGEPSWLFDWGVDPTFGPDTLILTTTDGSDLPTVGWELVGSDPTTLWVLPGNKVSSLQLAPSSRLYVLRRPPIPW